MDADDRGDQGFLVQLPRRRLSTFCVALGAERRLQFFTGEAPLAFKPPGDETALEHSRIDRSGFKVQEQDLRADHNPVVPASLAVDHEMFLGALVKRSGDYWITLLGEVPQTTLQQFASAIEYKAPR